MNRNSDIAAGVVVVGGVVLIAAVLFIGGPLYGVWQQ